MQAIHPSAQAGRYEAINATGKRLEIVFVSSDHDQKEFEVPSAASDPRNTFCIASLPPATLCPAPDGAHVSLL